MVFLVNKRMIFRFAKHRRADAALHRELAVLPELERSVRTAIPRFQYVGRWSSKELLFVGYRKISGTALTRETLYPRDGKPRASIARDLAGFLHELHSFPVSRAMAIGVQERHLRRAFKAELLDARELVYPVIRQRCTTEADAMISAIERAFRTYLLRHRNFRFPPTVLHGDLEAAHILVDPRAERPRVNGIIDFGSVHIGDPVFDLWRPYAHFGMPLIESLLKYYPLPQTEHLSAKMEFFWTAQAVHRVLRPILVKDEATLAERALPALKVRLLSDGPSAEAGVRGHDEEASGPVGQMRRTTAHVHQRTAA